ISGLSPGNHSVQLNGIAQNCTVSSNPRTVSITAGSTITTTFTVSCAATTGTLTVSNSTTSSNLDADASTVAGSGPAGTARNPFPTRRSSDLISGLSPGNHSVQLNGIAQNCTVSSNPRTVSITAGSTITTTFTVSCAATTGTLTVSNSTT